MKKMIAYRMDEESIGKIARMAHALRITKTAVIEYALDYCCDNETFIGYSMDRREGLDPEVGNSLSDGLRKSRRKSHSK